MGSNNSKLGNKKTKPNKEVPKAEQAKSTPPENEKSSPTPKPIIEEKQQSDVAPIAKETADSSAVITKELTTPVRQESEPVQEEKPELVQEKIAESEPVEEEKPELVQEKMTEPEAVEEDKPELVQEKMTESEPVKEEKPESVQEKMTESEQPVKEEKPESVQEKMTESEQPVEEGKPELVQEKMTESEQPVEEGKPELVQEKIAGNEPVNGTPHEDEKLSAPIQEIHEVITETSPVEDIVTKPEESHEKTQSDEVTANPSTEKIIADEKINSMEEQDEMDLKTKETEETDQQISREEELPEAEQTEDKEQEKREKLNAETIEENEPMVDDLKLMGEDVGKTETDAVPDDGEFPEPPSEEAMTNGHHHEEPAITNGNGYHEDEPQVDENMNFDRKFDLQRVIKKHLIGQFSIDEEMRAEKLANSFVDTWDLSKETINSNLEALCKELGITEDVEAQSNLREFIETQLSA